MYSGDEPRSLYLRMMYTQYVCVRVYYYMHYVYNDVDETRINTERVIIGRDWINGVNGSA
jgi:hypothetical protein